MLVEQGAVQEADPPALGGLVDSPGMEEWRGHPGVSVGGGAFHASPRSLDFIRPTAGSQGRLLAGG